MLFRSGEYDVFHVDTEVSDIMAFATDTKRFSNRQQGNQKTSTARLPREEWNKMTQEQRNKVIERIRQERQARSGGKPKPFTPHRQGNVHDVSDVVDIDDIIDYTIMNHAVDINEGRENLNEDADHEDTLLAY